MNTRQQQALDLIASGLSVVPIRPDGSKSPTVKWEPYQHRKATTDEVMRWFSQLKSGIGIVGGEISGGLEILDFDDSQVFEPWENLVGQIYEGLPAMLPLVSTPTGGFHVYYRANRVDGNQKLARRWDAGKPIAVRIETRGEGGYAVSPFAHPACHPLQCTYTMVRGDLTQIPLISHVAREVMLNSARAFDEYVDPPKRPAKPYRDRHSTDDRPGDIFAQTHSWRDILEPVGWRVFRDYGDKIEWVRPGKDDHGCSATTGHQGRDMLYVFSSNAEPFEQNRGYGKFTTYVLLHHGGDFHKAATALARGVTHGHA